MSAVGFVVGFYGSLIGTFAAIIVAFGTAQQVGPRLTRALAGCSTIALLCLALYQLWLGFGVIFA